MKFFQPKITDGVEEHSISIIVWIPNEYHYHGVLFVFEMRVILRMICGYHSPQVKSVVALALSTYMFLFASPSPNHRVRIVSLWQNSSENISW